MSIAIIVHGGHFRKVTGKKDDPGRLSGSIRREGGIKEICYVVIKEK